MAGLFLHVFFFCLFKNIAQVAKIDTLLQNIIKVLRNTCSLADARTFSALLYTFGYVLVSK